MEDRKAEITNSPGSMGEDLVWLDDLQLLDDGISVLTEDDDFDDEPVATILPDLAAVRRDALREQLEWAAARPLSPTASACEMLEPLSWIFDLIARRSLDPWGPGGGATALRVVRVLERLAPAARYDRIFAAIFEWGMHYLAEIVNVSDEDLQAEAALDFIGVLERSLGLDVDWPRGAPRFGPEPPEAGAPDFRDGFLATLRARTNCESFFALRTEQPRKPGKCWDEAHMWFQTILHTRLIGSDAFVVNLTHPCKSVATTFDTRSLGMPFAEYCHQILLHNNPLVMIRKLLVNPSELEVILERAYENGSPRQAFSRTLSPFTAALGGGRYIKAHPIFCHDPVANYTYGAAIAAVEVQRYGRAWL